MGKHSTLDIHANYHKEDSWNTVEIVFNGNKSEIYLNNYFLTEFSDSSYSSGSIALGVASNERSAVEVSFDNVSVYSITDQTNAP
jgi:hypothetical protein